MSSNFSDFWQKKLTVGLRNLPSTDPEEILRGKNLRKKIFFSHQLLILSRWFSDFWSKSSEGSLKLPSMCPEEIFKGQKTFELKSFFSISLWIWANDFQDSGEKCRKYLQSCNLTVQTNISPKKCFGEEEDNFFGFPGKKSQNFCEKLLAWLSNLPWVSRRKFWGNKTCKKELIQFFLTVGEKNISNFYPKSPSKAVREHSTYPEDEFQEIFFVRK